MIIREEMFRIPKQTISGSGSRIHQDSPGLDTDTQQQQRGSGCSGNSTYVTQHSLFPETITLKVPSPRADFKVRERSLPFLPMFDFGPAANTVSCRSRLVQRDPGSDRD